MSNLYILFFTLNNEQEEHLFIEQTNDEDAIREAFKFKTDPDIMPMSDFRLYKIGKRMEVNGL